MLKVDSHQHFWIFDPVKNNWITEEMEVIRHDFLPHDLKPLLDANGIQSCVAVQAEQSEAETEFLLSLAAENNFIKGVVGWADLCSDHIHERLEHYSQFPELKGFRHVMQAEPPGFMYKPQFQRGIEALRAYQFSYDILIYASQLDDAIELVRRNPDQPFVLDHIAKPDIKNGEMQAWKKGIETISEFQNVSCKISGMITEADHKNWKKEDIFPYLDHVFEFFGSERLMYGSDWPVCKLAGEYEAVCGLLNDYLVELSLREQEMVWGKNATGFYKLV